VYEPFLLGRNDLIIADLGANIGLASYYFKDYAREVFAVEPSQQHLEELRKMLEFNKIANVTVCPYAISNKNGTTKFYHSENTTSFSLTNLTANNPDFEEVKTKTFDSFMAENKLDHLDLLKLDVEGEEGKVISSDGFKEYAPRIQTIIGEYHEWTNMAKPQFENTFRDLGYTFSWYYSTKASVFSAVRL